MQVRDFLHRALCQAACRRGRIQEAHGNIKWGGQYLKELEVFGTAADVAVNAIRG